MTCEKCRAWARKRSSRLHGFLRIPGAENPLDNSAVHPERYEFVVHMAESLGASVERLIGNAAQLKGIDRSSSFPATSACRPSKIF